MNHGQADRTMKRFLKSFFAYVWTLLNNTDPAILDNDRLIGRQEDRWIDTCSDCKAPV
jgi:hypothetical protein